MARCAQLTRLTRRAHGDLRALIPQALLAAADLVSEERHFNHELGFWSLSTASGSRVAAISTQCAEPSGGSWWPL